MDVAEVENILDEFDVSGVVEENLLRSTKDLGAQRIKGELRTELLGFFTSVG